MVGTVSERAKLENIKTDDHNSRYKQDLISSSQRYFENSIITQLKINNKISSIKEANRIKWEKHREQKQLKEMKWHNNKQVEEDVREENVEKLLQKMERNQQNVQDHNQKSM